MSDDPSAARVALAAETLLAAIADVPLDASQAEIIQALFVMAQTVAARSCDQRTVARLLMTLAEANLSAATPTAPVSETAGTQMHGAFEGAVQLLISRGLDRDQVRAGMLGYAMLWAEKAEGSRATSARLYSAADAMAVKDDGGRLN